MRKPQAFVDENIFQSKPDYLASRVAKARKTLAVLEDVLGAGRLAGLSVLEVGCLYGVASEFLAPHFGSYLGIDILPEAVETARRDRRVPAHGNLKFARMDAE